MTGVTFDPAQHPRNSQHGVPGNPGSFTTARHDDTPTTLRAPTDVVEAARNAIEERDATARYFEERLAKLNRESRVAARAAIIAIGEQSIPGASKVVIERPFGADAEPRVAGVIYGHDDPDVYPVDTAAHIALSEFASRLGPTEEDIDSVLGDGDFYSEHSAVRWRIDLD
ncbi:hypothetical protein ACWGJ9_10200 [Curtobacterium citreum]